MEMSVPEILLVRVQPYEVVRVPKFLQNISSYATLRANSSSLILLVYLAAPEAPPSAPTRVQVLVVLCRSRDSSASSNSRFRLQKFAMIL